MGEGWGGAFTFFLPPKEKYMYKNFAGKKTIRNFAARKKNLT